MDINYFEESLKLHKANGGKIEVITKVPLETKYDLAIAYTPGVAQPSLEITKDPENAYSYTCKANLAAVVTDGSAVPGLGNVGGMAALPFMEGKSILYKAFGGVDAIPICLDTQNTNEIVSTVKNIAPAFGGVSLEAISAPRCFDIERRLQDELDIPVFHVDQHGTAIVATAAIINAYRLLKKPLKSVKAVISGAGVAGAAIVRALLKLGIRDIVVCDSFGIISTERLSDLSRYKIDLLEITNKRNVRGGLAEAVADRDLFIGVSKPKLLTEEMVSSMNENPVVFALSYPEPELAPDLAKNSGAAIVGTGSPDFPNQISNILAFPGVLRGALDARAKYVTPEMRLAASYAIADMVSAGDLNADYVIPSVFDKRVAGAVASAAAQAWKDR